MTAGRNLAVIAFTAAFAVGCGGAQDLEPPAAPRRPKAEKAQAKAARDVRKDCRATDPNALPAGLPYKDRSIIEAENLAVEGVKLLRESENTNTPKLARESLFTDAVDRLLKALEADPYNVHATYNLAAAFARIGRGQCAVNLLARMVELRKRESQKAEVEKHLDRLLGRGTYRGKLDPDFYDLRDDPGFREVVKNF